jgi:hypothetical protein
MHDSLQIVIALLGVLSQILVLGQHIYAKGDVKTGRLDSGSGSPSNVTKSNKRPPRKLIDLAFVLLCSAFFALLLTDSLIISGRNPAPGLGTIVIVTVISLTVVTLMGTAWVLGLGELVTGCLAVTTLIVLLLSAGGPFFSSESDTVAGLSLLIPTVSLVTLAASMFIYSFGSPLSRSVQNNKRVGVSLILLAIIMISSAALGKALVMDVVNDPRNPKISQGQALIHKIMGVSLQDRRKFYRLASEISLSRTYQKYFRAVSLDQLLNETTQTDQKSPQELKSSLPSKVRSGNNQPTKQTSELIDDVQTISSLKQDLSGSTVEPDVLRAQGFSRTDFLFAYFETLDLLRKEEYLINRLGWIHPAGLDNQSTAAISLPGTTPDERFESTSSLRQFLTLYDQPNFRQKILKEFEYPEQIRQFFRVRDEKSESRIRLFGETELSPPNSLYRPTLFPKFDATVTNAQLRQQLTLPLRPEAYLAYKQYKETARLITENEFKNRLSEADFDRLTGVFNNLDEQAQDAFLDYVINNKKISTDKVYQTLLDLKGIDFTTFASSPDPLAVEKLVSILEGNKLDNKDLQDLGERITTTDSRQAKDTFLELLKGEHSDISIKKLFQSQVFNLVDQSHKFLADDKRDFFDAVADPVWIVTKHIASASSSRDTSNNQSEAPSLTVYLAEFRKLDEQDKAGVLQQLAISLYQPGGPYSLDPIRLIVSQARTWNNIAGLVCASLLSLPPLFVGLFVGEFLSRKLVARDRIREIIEQESDSYPEEGGIFGNPVEALHGRSELLGSLRKLAERGWSTIGIVGRRGVGKSRLLYSLFRSEFDEPLAPTVKAWVASPSKFEEEDFIYSIFERLAISTEGRTASYLGARPLSTRRIEHRGAQVSSWFYAASFVILGIVIYEMYNRLTRSDIVVAWWPILALVLSSVVVFVYYLSKLQPVNLASWLQRDRNQNPHTVMLYKEVYEALEVLRDRKRGRAGVSRQRGDTLRQLAMTGFAMLFSLSIGFIVLSIDRPYSDFALLLTLIIAGLSCWAWLYLFQRRAVAQDRITNYGQSVMSLIADYRAFAATIVYRLRQGALGHSVDRRFSVLICIDELDKIVDFAEIRQFLRKIKAIFEVPGVYYYVSLAQDTLTALYLGSASGKNEIDSAFDHIVSIEPLSCDVGEQIVLEYLSSHDFKNGPTRLERVIAAIAFGIPRDMIRRCDELLAQHDHSSLQASAVPSDLRRMQASMGYDLHQISKAQMRQLASSPLESALAAEAMSNSVQLGDPQHRIILSTWVLSLIEVATGLDNEQRWKEVSQALSSIGYRLPLDPLADIQEDVLRVHSELVAGGLNSS